MSSSFGVAISGNIIAETAPLQSENIAGGNDVRRLKYPQPSLATLFGDVIDAHGAPAEDTTVILFPQDESKWGPRNGLVRAVLCDIDGRFTMAGLATGLYYVLPRERVRDGAWNETPFLRSLVDPAVRLELREGVTEISLKVED